MNTPYNADDMNQAVDYAKVTKQLFQVGMKEAAYQMFCQDPNGNEVSFEFFCQVMERKSNNDE